MSAGTIRQPATVTRVTSSEIDVEVCRPEACQGCKAHKMCHMEEDGKGKSMTLINDGQGYYEGEQVMLVMRRSSGLKAALIAYLIPVVLLIATLLICQSAGETEIVSAVITLSVLVLYFIGVRLLRGRLNREFSIEIEKVIDLIQ